MLLYLVQHGEAKREEQDPSRPLSDKGIEDVKGVASYISRLNIEVEEVLHSGKARAKQTAELLSGNLRIAKGISQTDGIAPLDAPKLWVERLKQKKNSLMLVGHLPHLGKLSSLLLSGDKEKNIIAFKMGGIVCLKRDDAGTWSLQWMITPEIL
ncbi:MAG TPA: phosphohistidine phosphatase SixA [Thermodesulfovibrionales bacterium]|nr:phosphohistidine phosphatase SixA [Thermodesulfovibrionales bacterium]